MREERCRDFHRKLNIRGVQKVKRVAGNYIPKIIAKCRVEVIEDVAVNNKYKRDLLRCVTSSFI